jgi:hypothetical protein
LATIPCLWRKFRNHSSRVAFTASHSEAGTSRNSRSLSYTPSASKAVQAAPSLVCRCQVPEPASLGTHLTSSSGVAACAVRMPSKNAGEAHQAGRLALVARRPLRPLRSFKVSQRLNKARRRKLCSEQVLRSVDQESSNLRFRRLIHMTSKDPHGLHAPDFAQT